MRLGSQLQMRALLVPSLVVVVSYLVLGTVMVAANRLGIQMWQAYMIALDVSLLVVMAAAWRASSDEVPPQKVPRAVATLGDIRLWTEFDVLDAQKMAEGLADPNDFGKVDHWVETSYELLTGLLLHVAYAEPNKSLAGCGAYLSDPQIFLKMLNSRHDPGMTMGWRDDNGQQTATHPMVAKVARAMLSRGRNERTSIVSVTLIRLSIGRKKTEESHKQGVR